MLEQIQALLMRTTGGRCWANLWSFAKYVGEDSLEALLGWRPSLLVWARPARPSPSLPQPARSWIVAEDALPNLSQYCKTSRLRNALMPRAFLTLSFPRVNRRFNVFAVAFQTCVFFNIHELYTYAYSSRKKRRSYGSLCIASHPSH